MKECSFQPKRDDTKKYDNKVDLLKNIDSYERVYKFQV